jgi:cell division transport system ATP-binding protein
MIQLTNATKEYPRTGVAVDNVSLHVAKGEFAFLTGPSGSGKSTLLKLIYMDERPTRGEVRVSGVNSHAVSRRDVSRLRRRLGIVFQDFRLLEDRTAQANVAFALEVTGAPPESIPTKVSRLLMQVGLAAKAAAFPRELSGGEQQRVALARALAPNPAILVADEPTGNLDEVTGASIIDLMFALKRERSATLIVVTHDPALASKCERRIELRSGRIEAAAMLAGN